MPLVFVFVLNAFAQEPGNNEKIIIKTGHSPTDLHNFGEILQDDPGISLALSGGGARGLAHIGVLKVLREEGIRIDFIAGVSMGGIIGGLYSSGYSPEELEDIALNADWRQLFSPSPLRNSLLTSQKGLSEKSIVRIRFNGWKPSIPRAITSGQNLSQFLDNLVSRRGIRSNISFDYLEPPMKIVCTDLNSGEKIVLSSGSLSEAMRASMAVPIAFTPVDINGRLLVDGGLVDPIPVDVVKKESSYPVIAVNTSSDLTAAGELDNVIGIADQTTTIMSMENKKESIEKADLLIAPELEGINSMDFFETEKIIRMGEEAARKAISEIRTLIQTQKAGNNSQPYSIADWDIKGLSLLPKTVMKQFLYVNSKLSTENIKRNLDNLLSTGYISDAYAELVPTDSGYNLIYYLTNNSRIENIHASGATVVTDLEIERSLESRKGQILNYNSVISDVSFIENLYLERGYSLIRVSSNFNTQTGLLSYFIDEGRINKITLSGNNRTKSWAINRHIPFKQNDLFIQKKAKRAVDDLYSTMLFETAKLLVVPDTVGVTLNVIVEEKPSFNVRSGARFDLEYGSRMFVDIAEDNLFGVGQRMFLSTTVGEKKRSVSFNVVQDRIFKTLFTNSLKIGYEEFKKNRYVDHDYDTHFSQFNHGIDFSVGRQIPRLGTFGIFGSYQRYSWYEPDEIEFQKYDKGSIGIRSRVDTRDSFDFPSSGKYHQFDLEFAGDLSDNRTPFTKMFTSLESYYQITDDLNFHPKLSLGLASDFLPYFAKFSLGGLHNFAGLYEDELLGDKLIQGEIEFRYLINSPLYFYTRYNVGNIWSKLEEIKISEFRNSIGAGLALKTPFGPISGWYGRTQDGEDVLYFYAGYDW